MQIKIYILYFYPARISLFKQLEMSGKVIRQSDLQPDLTTQPLKINIFNSDFCCEIKWTISQSFLAVFNNISFI